jgi:hypothetical protein
MACHGVISAGASDRDLHQRVMPQPVEVDAPSAVT